MNEQEERITKLMKAESYWIAKVMQEQGSRFYRALGLALEASDLANRRLIYSTWTDGIWDFYQRTQNTKQE